MWKCAAALTVALALSLGDGAFADSLVRAAAKSGVETLVKTCHGLRGQGLSEQAQVLISKPPSHGTARVAYKRVAGAGGQTIRVAQVFYRSKPGFVGTDSFAVRSIGRLGDTENFTLSVSVR